MRDDHPVFDQALAPLFTRRRSASRRASSWDRTGANRDFLVIGPGETVTLLEHAGAGCVTHVYCAMVLPDLTDYRDAILRCFWDGTDRPAVEVPLGDFFGLAHARTRELSSLLVAVNPGLGSSHGLNAYFPMPFSAGARITLENRGPRTLGGALGAFWYHIEYEVYDRPIGDEVHRFHAHYRQERPTGALGPEPNVTLHDAPNLDGAGNYVALDTTGEGRMVGLVLEVDNVQGEKWYGEGDDMAFVDGEQWPPSIHGTGTEEIFGGGACPSDEYASAYSGFHLIESERYDGRVGMYRWYVHDPIHFATSLRWTVEHGHANNFANDYASVAYWYQTPVAHLPPLPERSALLPRLGDRYEEARDLLFATSTSAREAAAGQATPGLFLAACQAGRAFYLGDWDRAIADLTRFRREHDLE
jgi:hypothetical protein